jgi:hypothetical protein
MFGLSASKFKLIKRMLLKKGSQDQESRIKKALKCGVGHGGHGGDTRITTQPSPLSLLAPWSSAAALRKER